MDSAYHQLWRTIRYSLASNARTARLASLIMLIATIYWYLFL
jgi:hypothetical protein